MGKNLEENCTREVIALHQFFEDWFKGILADTDENYARLTAVLHPTFHIINPNGTITDYPDLVAGLRQGHGSRPDFRLWVEKVMVRPLSPTLALVTYEEWQEIAGKVTARVSTAVFQQAANTPHNVQWLHVHETWLAV